MGRVVDRVKVSMAGANPTRESRILLNLLPDSEGNFYGVNVVRP